MKKKKLIGFACVVIGVVILLLGFYAKAQVNERRSAVSKTSGLFPNNPMKKGINNAIEGKIGSYDSPILWTLIIGGVIVVIGAGILHSSRKTKR